LATFLASIYPKSDFFSFNQPSREIYTNIYNSIKLVSLISLENMYYW